MRHLQGNIKLTLSFALAFSLAGCKSNPPAPPATIVDMNNGADPAAANLAPVDPNASAIAPAAQSGYSSPAPASGGRVLGQRSEYPQAAPSSEQYPAANEQGSSLPANDDAYDQYDQQVNAGQDALYADQAPPPLPVYDQPQLTEANDQWTPGYWNSNNAGYYFVPGAWVAPPYTGALWTPGYWGYEGRRYRFHRGFWGRHIGFYGGINYGFGYTGRGYEGGYWNNNNFFYNQRVNRVNVADVRNVYVRNVTAVNNDHYSYNGPGGYQGRPSPAELAVYHEQRLPPQQAQLQVREQAAGNRQQFFAENHGRPAVAVAPQRFAADRQPARPIEPVQRGGFGQPGGNPQAQQLHGQQEQQQQLQQQQLRTQENQQRTAQQQQHNAQVQQGEQQREQQLQQRDVQQQQRAQQLQQRDSQQLNTQQQQRVQADQQRNAAVQQQNAQRQQQVQAQQQRTQQNAAAQQQRATQEQQRATQEQQRSQQIQQRPQQVPAQQQARPAPQQPPAQRQPQVQQRQPQVQQPQPQVQQRQPQVQQRQPEVQQQREVRPAPQQVPRAAPAPQAAPAPRPAPAPAAAPHAETPHPGGERPPR